MNLAGTFAFGLSGGILAVRKQLDLFGVLVLSVATALGGGVTRDLLLGHTPPTTLTDWRYIASALIAGLTVFSGYNRIVNHEGFIKTFDAVGLAVFTVTGTSIALDSGLGPVAAVLLGMLTGIGGGIIRDILAAEIPLVLRTEIYAIASILGATIIIVANQLGLDGLLADAVAAAATLTLRLVSIRKGWRIPIRMVKQEC